LINRTRSLSIELKSLDQVRLMRAAGLVVARGLRAMSDAAVPGASTADLDAIGRDVLRKAGATASFLGYHGYPAVICASVNDRVVHGIPSAREVLREGDLISIDFGAIVDGWHGDAAVTVAVGEVEPAAAALSEACRVSLWDGIAQARSGGRLSNISHAVEQSVRASGTYGIVTGYGGHGIGTSMHMDPHILNHGRPGRGPRLEPGMALAIEPMLTLGSRDTRELDDGWTVVTADGTLAAHWEHTVAILADGPWVLTAEDGGRAELAARGVGLSTQAAA
jgi:methionyl aminopeptidase